MFYGYRKVPCWYQGSPRPPRGRRDRGVVFILLMIKAGLGTSKLDFQPRTAGQSRPKPPPRQRTAGQAQAWQGREGLDYSSIVPRLFLDCCLPQPPLARSFPAMLLGLPCIGVSPITHPYTDGSGVRGGNGGSLPALGIIPADACIRSAAAPCWLCGICMAHRRMRLLLRNEHTT